MDCCKPSGLSDHRYEYCTFRPGPGMSGIGTVGGAHNDLYPLNGSRRILEGCVVSNNVFYPAKPNLHQ